MSIHSRAQVLDDVDHVHPGWTLSQLRPAAWQPQVSGLARLPDGNLLVLEMTKPNVNRSGTPKPDGNLWVASNLDAADPEQIKYVKAAGGLAEPVGLVYKAGKIYIAEKNEINEYTLDAAESKAIKTRTVAKIPHDSSGEVNFQEYAFGLLYKDGYFYVSIGGAVKFGGRSFDSLPAKLNEDRVGCVLKIGEADGAIAKMNAGFRAGNGIAWGPEGTIWVTDNQGSYRPGSQLTVAQEGKNYGYPNKPGAYSDLPVTPPSLWLAHGAIAQSPTFPVLLEHGPYAGQFLFGDIAQGGIKRAFVEKVEGTWQGAAFSFTGGLEVGIEKIIENPDGSLYAGGMGNGDVDNWGWKGKLFGLQKLTPKAGATAFEMLAIRARKNGMEIEFTKPVGAEGGLASSYGVQQAQMVPQSGYGVGSMDKPATLPVKGVQVSPDGKKVFLQVDLTANRVLVIKALGVKSSTGEAVRCPAGWYTLNALSQSGPFPTNVVARQPAETMASDIKIAALASEVRILVPIASRYELSLRAPDGRLEASQAGDGAREYIFPARGLARGVHIVEVKAAGTMLRRSFLR
ncbi:MAG TPA: hypothetical protein VJ385_06005 [Fibrobacteria bacterium]|nr:hypothetical protein [Fibrobacteria bacterium]